MRPLRIASGFLLLTAGIVMLVTPGPGWLAVGGGLGLLASEFAWARRLLDALTQRAMNLRVRG